MLATISDKKIGVSLSADSSLIDHYEADVQTAQDYYPFGMIMPGRMLATLSIPGGSISGTTTVNGYTLPVDLTLNGRTGNQPTSYVATDLIDLNDGFESGANDDVTAYIADGSYAGGGNGSNDNAVAGGGKYRYGFNGKEKDDEVKGVGDQIDYGMRVYDPRVGRFLSVDPLQKQYPALTPYQFASNSPIANVDVDGRESYWYQFDIDKKTGNVAVTLTAVKISWLDWITPSHLVVKIGEHDWEYDADYIKSSGELDRQIALIKKDPAAYYAKMQESHKKLDAELAQWHEKQKKNEEVMWAIAFGAKFHKEAAASTTVAAEEESRAANSGNKSGKSSAIEQSEVKNSSSQSASEAQETVTLKNTTPPVSGKGFKYYSLKATIENGFIAIPGRPTTTGNFDFIINNEGQLMPGRAHMVVSNGAESVLAAGEMKIRNGRLIAMTNSSGHYLSTIDEGKRAVEFLSKMGVDTKGARITLLNKDGSVNKTYINK